MNLVLCLYCQKLFSPGRRHLCENGNGILVEPYRSNTDFQTITVKKEGICSSTSISTENYNNTNNFKTREIHQNSTFALSTSVSKLGLIGNPQFATSNPTTAEEITNDTTMIPKPKYREECASEIVNNLSISIQNKVFSVNYDEDIFGDAESVKNMIADILRSDNISQERNRVSNDENCHSILNINQSFESLGNEIGVEYNEITFPNYGETFVPGIPMNRMNPFSRCAQNDQTLFVNAHLRNTTPILPIQKNEPNCILSNSSLHSGKTDPTLNNSILHNQAVCPETEEEKQVTGYKTTTTGNKFEANNKILLKGEEYFLGLRFHSEDRRHKCKRCGKVFERKEDVQTHICVRTGDKRYKCDYCERTFTRKDHKEEHVRTHTGEKLYECEHFGKTFTQKGHKNAHVRTHTGEKRFECEYCGKTFTQKGNKERHTRVHTGEKPYECEYCGKTFTQKHSKQRHNIRTHTGEKPNKCRICGRAFKYIKTFKYHKCIIKGG